jgi:hypothetical protein
MILRQQLRFLAGVAVVLVHGLVFGAAPAGAHAGGRAELYLVAFRVEPAQPTGWTVRALVSDRDTGKPLPGFDVKLTGTSPSGSAFGPVALTDPDARGRYGGTISPSVGQWALTVDARGFPGGAEGIPLTRTIEVDLEPGVAAHALTGGRVHASGGVSRAWMVASMLAALIAAVSGRWIRPQIVRLGRSGNDAREVQCEGKS